ncbi:uncharacterized protein METZ01_LOCUS273901, partial [marine metagenome]
KMDFSSGSAKSPEARPQKRRLY